MNRRYINKGPDMRQQYDNECQDKNGHLIDDFISKLPERDKLCKQHIKKLQQAIANIQNMQQRMQQSRQTQQTSQQVSQALAGRVPQLAQPQTAPFGYTQAPQQAQCAPVQQNVNAMAPAQAPQPQGQMMNGQFNYGQQWAFEGRNRRGRMMNEETTVGELDDNEVEVWNNLPQYFQSVQQMSQQVYQIELFIGQLKKQGLI